MDGLRADGKTNKQRRKTHSDVPRKRRWQSRARPTVQAGLLSATYALMRACDLVSLFLFFLFDFMG